MGWTEGNAIMGDTVKALEKKLAALEEHPEPARREAEIYRLRNIELEEALAQVKQLSGLLPICANCKKVRDDEGYWHDVAVYIHKHSEADFSHGICPDCLQELYPEFYRGEQVDKWMDRVDTGWMLEASHE